jgi:hypothetical protein
VKGTLKEITLADVVQLLVMNRKTGRLALESDQRKAYIDFNSGTIVNAVSGDLEGEQAFYDPFCWDSGGFEFLPDEKIDTVLRLGRNWQQMLFEAVRRAGEWEELRRKVGNGLSIPHLVGKIEPTLYDRESAERKVFLLIDGRRNIHTLANLVGLPMREVLLVLGKFLDSGVITVDRNPVTDHLERLLAGYIGPSARNFTEREVRRLGGEIELANRRELLEVCRNAEAFARDYISRAESKALHDELVGYINSIFRQPG